MELAFFSFVRLEGGSPEQHRTYNEWHQLDHQPENLALPGVAWGDRWARTQACKDASHGHASYADTDYVAMYWFSSPTDQARSAWNRLGEDSFQWGRGPLIPGVRRDLLAFFRPVKGYVSRSALVSPQALAYRPNLGLHLTLTRYDEPHGAGTHASFAWEDRRVVPSLLDMEGVAGVWTFSFTEHQQRRSRRASGTSEDPAGSLRMRLVYLDGDPLTTSTRLAAVEEELAADPAAPDESGQVLLWSPLRTIIPWQDW